MFVEIDLNTWNRKQQYEHFIELKDPYFALTIPFDVTTIYNKAKQNNISVFALYLHACMKSINSIEQLRYRILDGKVVVYDVIHASPTIMRSDNTFGFSFVKFNKNFNEFRLNLENEKIRVNNSKNLYPPINGLDCIHCSALPWINFTGHKEPVSELLDSVPKLAFGKIVKEKETFKMNVAISVNHALVDGYHIGLFVDIFQKYLNE